MAWLLTWNHDENSAPLYKRDFVPAIDPVLRARATLGMHLKHEEIDAIPRTLEVELLKGRTPPNIMNITGRLLILSDKLHSALRELGERHVASVPVTIREQDNFYSYHLLHSPPHIGCFVEEETVFPLGPYPHAGNGARCVMWRSKIAEHHLWMAGSKDVKWSHKHEWFLSDQFAAYVTRETVGEVDLMLYCNER